MPTISVINKDGKSVGEMNLAENVFEAEPNPVLVTEVVTLQQIAARQGNSCIKTRGNVRGGGKKPWKQKGTGRARVGSIRSPLWKGGGTVFGPHPKNFQPKINRKKKRGALWSALSEKYRAGKIIVTEDIRFESPKTQQFVQMLDNFKVDGTVLMIVDKMHQNLMLSARNLPKVKTINVDNINIYDLLRYDWVIISQESVERLHSGVTENE